MVFIRLGCQKNELNLSLFSTNTIESCWKATQLQSFAPILSGALRFILSYMSSRNLLTSSITYGLYLSLACMEVLDWLPKSSWPRLALSNRTSCDEVKELYNHIWSYITLILNLSFITLMKVDYIIGQWINVPIYLFKSTFFELFCTSHYL